MKPISCVVTRDGYKLVHECVVCGTQQANISAPDDSIESLAAVSSQAIQLLA